MAEDSRVHHTERSKWRHTFRRLVADALAAVYGVAYLFQGIGMLWVLDIVSRPVMITIDARVVQVWDAITP